MDIQFNFDIGNATLINLTLLEGGLIPTSIAKLRKTLTKSIFNAFEVSDKGIAQSRSDIYIEGKFELVRLKDSALKQLIIIGAAKKRYLIDLITEIKHFEKISKI